MASVQIQYTSIVKAILNPYLLLFKVFCDVANHRIFVSCNKHHFSF